MNIFFDMDYTIIETDYGTLRPGVRYAFERLRGDGHAVYIWSGMGVRTDEVQALGLSDLVDGVFEKPWEDYERSVGDMLERNELPEWPDLVVDDTAAIVRALGGILVQQYGALSPATDREMERVYRIIREYTENGYSHHPAFRHLSARRQRARG